jgi:hypothetical protein
MLSDGSDPIPTPLLGKPETVQLELEHNVSLRFCVNSGRGAFTLGYYEMFRHIGFVECLDGDFCVGRGLKY